MSALTGLTIAVPGLKQASHASDSHKFGPTSIMPFPCCHRSGEGLFREQQVFSRWLNMGQFLLMFIQPFWSDSKSLRRFRNGEIMLAKVALCWSGVRLESCQAAPRHHLELFETSNESRVITRIELLNGVAELFKYALDLYGRGLHRSSGFFSQPQLFTCRRDLIGTLIEGFDSFLADRRGDDL